MPSKDPDKIKEIRRRFYEKNKDRVKEKVAAYKLAKKLSDPKRPVKEKAERERAIKRKRKCEIYAIVQERKRRNLELEQDHWWRNFYKFFCKLGFIKVEVPHKHKIKDIFDGSESEMVFTERIMVWRDLSTTFSLYTPYHGGNTWNSERMRDDFKRFNNFRFLCIPFEEARRVYVYHCNRRFKYAILLRDERLRSNKEFMARMDEVLKNVTESKSSKTKVVLAFMKMAKSIK